MNNSCFYWDETSDNFVMGLTTSDSSDIAFSSSSYLTISNDSLFLSDGTINKYSITTNGFSDLSFNTNGGLITFGTNNLEFGKLKIGPLVTTTNVLVSSIITNPTSIYATSSTGLEVGHEQADDIGSGAIFRISASGGLDTTSNILVPSITTNNYFADSTSGPTQLTDIVPSGGSGSGVQFSLGVSGSLSTVDNSLLLNISSNTTSITVTNIEGQKNISTSSTLGSGALVTIFASGILKVQNITDLSSIASPTDARDGTVSIPAEDVIGGSGSGATFLLTIANNVVSNIAITDGGSGGYFAGETLTIPASSIPSRNSAGGNIGNSNANCSFVLSADDITGTTVTGINVTSGGSGYFVGNQLVIAQSDVSGSSGNLIIDLVANNLDSSGVTDITVTSPGTGYFSGEVLTIDASNIPSTDGSNNLEITLVANNVVSDGITAVTVSEPGKSYKINDVITISQSNLPGADSNLVFQLKPDDISVTPLGPIVTDKNELLGSITQNTTSVTATNDIGIEITETTTSGSGSGVVLNLVASGSIITTSDALLNSISSNTSTITTGTYSRLPTTSSGEGINCLVTLVASGSEVELALNVHDELKKN